MRIHHLRNATMVIESGNNVILVDPMLDKKGTQPPFTLFRFKPKKNPLVELPPNSEEILNKVTHCLVTHLHPDHLDKKAISFLKEKQIPVYCNRADASKLRKQGLNIACELENGEEKEFLGGKIIGTPARHGYGFIANPMSPVLGFLVQLPNEPSLYISADTIYTDEVKKILQDHKPDVCVLASGQAQLDLGSPLLMKLDSDQIQFIKDAPGKVIANHMEALNHCPITRQQLKNELIKNNLLEKVFIPEDGEIIQI